MEWGELGSLIRVGGWWRVFTSWWWGISTIWSWGRICRFRGGFSGGGRSRFRCGCGSGNRFSFGVSLSAFVVMMVIMLAMFAMLAVFAVAVRQIGKFLGCVHLVNAMLGVLAILEAQMVWVDHHLVLL